MWLGVSRARTAQIIVDACRFCSSGAGCVKGKDCPNPDSTQNEGAYFQRGQFGHRAANCPVVGCEPGKDPPAVKWPESSAKGAGKGKATIGNTVAKAAVPGRDTLEQSTNDGKLPREGAEASEGDRCQG